MKDSILRETEDGTKMVFSGGKEFVEAVAHASSKEELRQLLKAGGIYEFSEEELEESYKNLALSQDWEALSELFRDRDYDSCRRKLEAHGITTTREHFDLINEVVATASDDALIREILHKEDMESTLEALHRHGYRLSGKKEYICPCKDTETNSVCSYCVCHSTAGSDAIYEGALPLQTGVDTV
ncbi:hypothetical protein [Marvinbryantia formatexigens]|nr:hypothetical protein [Marvinbryantia formatexigens]UWO25948.1 hypothetical protein NQ534_05620 [Marvinbryantia formatexigens DSM 14469]SDF44186.1 hypothetical protein SAMN05660368_00768 [Marvinbryantia formatexigens]